MGEITEEQGPTEKTKNVVASYGLEAKETQAPCLK
jgi:hypothetical protein